MRRKYRRDPQGFSFASKGKGQVVCFQEFIGRPKDQRKRGRAKTGRKEEEKTEGESARGGKEEKEYPQIYRSKQGIKK